MTAPTSPNDDRIDDLEQKPINGEEAETVKGGANVTEQPPLIRVPSPRKLDPCLIIPCI